ncbi:hypothetical protein BaRGS_00013665 [Batillaria attramentaria]|uniref:Uncharacterized protein n=1 Tax=Batillaria attramentaria TaxID=370345 RepID=A0ABD0L7A9_9CAEN
MSGFKDPYREHSSAKAWECQAWFANQWPQITSLSNDSVSYHETRDSDPLRKTSASTFSLSTKPMSLLLTRRVPSGAGIAMLGHLTPICYLWTGTLVRNLWEGEGVRRGDGCTAGLGGTQTDLVVPSRGWSWSGGRNFYLVRQKYFSKYVSSSNKLCTTRFLKDMVAVPTVGIRRLQEKTPLLGGPITGSEGLRRLKCCLGDK